MVTNKSPIERFWKHVNVIEDDDSCWEWQASCFENGYGQFILDGTHVKAHRYSYYLENGPLPEDIDICHSCDNRKCVRPKHLFPGTRSDNMQDASKKGRIARGERVPQSKLTESQVREIRQDTRPQWEIANQFGIDQGMVSKIKTRKSWKHVL